MGKAARKRAASTDSGSSASSSEASLSKRDGSKRPRQAELDSVQGTTALSLDPSAAGPSETTASSAPSLKIFNFNANGILKAFERSDKRLDKLLREEGEPRLAGCSGGVTPERGLTRRADGRPGHCGVHRNALRSAGATKGETRGHGASSGLPEAVQGGHIGVAERRLAMAHAEGGFCSFSRSTRPSASIPSRPALRASLCTPSSLPSQSQRAFRPQPTPRVRVAGT